MGEARRRMRDSFHCEEREVHPNWSVRHRQIMPATSSTRLA